MERTPLTGPLPWLIVLLAVLGAGGMLFEGLRAFRLDEPERSSAQQIQQLGVWARVLVESGIHPRSVAMNAFFCLYGSAWLAIAVAFALGYPWARLAMVVAAVGSLGYLGSGTLIAALLLVLLWLSGR